MKRVFLILLTAIIFSSCQKESDPIFEKSTDLRVNAQLKEYSDLLVDAKYGWKSEYFPGSLATGGWSFLMKFKADGIVTMMSDFNKATATTEKVSHYRIGCIQKPSLIFDSYSSLHILSDPSVGQAGAGLKGDFQFEIQGIKNDTLYLKGHFDGSILKLVRATAKDVNLEPRIDRRAEFKTFFANPDAPLFRTLMLGRIPVDISYDDAKKRVVVKYVKGGTTVREIRAIAFSDNEAVLSSPLSIPGVDKPIKSLPFTGNSDGSLLVNMEEYGVKATLSYTELPAVPYLDGIKDIQLIGLMNVLSISPSLQGVFAGIEAIPNFKDLQFYFGSEGFNEIGVYVPGVKPNPWYDYDVEWTYGADGILRAKYLGTKTGATYESKVKPFLDRVCTPEGYVVMDIKGQSAGAYSVYSVVLVSRRNTNDRITLYTMF